MPFKIVPLGSYTPMETLFPFLVAVLEIFNCYVFSMSVTIEKTSVLIFLTESPMSKIALVVRSQVKNSGFLNTILRPRGKVRGGTL